MRIAVDGLTASGKTTFADELAANLAVDGVFAFRAELVDEWDLKIWLSIDAELSIRRGVDRDAEFEGGRQHAEVLHRDRYLAAELIYIREVDPTSIADVVIDNTDIRAPALRRC